MPRARPPVKSARLHLVLFKLREPPPDDLQVRPARVVDETGRVAALTRIDDLPAVVVHEVAGGGCASGVGCGSLTLRRREEDALGGTVFVVGQDAPVALVLRDDLAAPLCGSATGAAHARAQEKGRRFTSPRYSMTKSPFLIGTIVFSPNPRFPVCARDHQSPRPSTDGRTSPVRTQMTRNPSLPSGTPSRLLKGGFPHRSGPQGHSFGSQQYCIRLLHRARQGISLRRSGLTISVQASGARTHRLMQSAPQPRSLTRAGGLHEQTAGIAALSGPRPK